MTAVLAGILFFALIMASIALHEVGHLLPAKLFGVKVTQYFVGFGKTLWSIRRGGTQYGLKLLPLGGYVRLVGMFPPVHPNPRAGRLAELADSARAGEWADITDDDVARGRLFYQKKTWQKLIIMFGGPAMNILLAFLIFLGVNLLFGQVRPQLTIATVSDCVEAAPAPCLPSPAARAGLEPGDTVLELNGARVADWASFTAAIRANGTGPVQLVVDRPGAGPTSLASVPGTVRAVQDPANPGKTLQAGFLGVTSTTAVVKVGPVGTARDLVGYSDQTVRALVGFPVRIVTTAVDLVTGKPRDAAGPMSIIGASRAAGEIASSGQLPAISKLAFYFSLLGSVNLFVAILNLVPLLPFDGGHIAGAIIEWVRRIGARLLGGRDPGHLDTAKLLPVAYVVGGFLLVAGVVLIAADLLSPISLF